MGGVDGWCRDTDWDRNRALVFLDPYGMSVNWSTLQSIAHTKGVDLWILLPVGSAINRMLPRERLPEDAWARSLTRIFGTEDWIDAFYRPRSEVQLGLPGLLDDEEMGFEKVASFRGIGEFFVHRLKQEFAGVSDDFLMLYNSRRIQSSCCSLLRLTSVVQIQRSG
jgi:three-Cys-motif partner protein